jgi:2,3-dihydroxybenzoate decarboxylase
MIINKLVQKIVCCDSYFTLQADVELLRKETMLFYDQPEYDEFWQAVSDLDVPVYFHPRFNTPEVPISVMYDHAPWLRGAQEFTSTLSAHVLGFCTNGVFESVPLLSRLVLGAY